MVAVLASCAGDGSNPVDPAEPIGTDFLTLAVNDGAPATFSEHSGLPNIDCDPRVDWGAYQVVLWDDFTNGNGPNGYERFFDIMFPVNDAVGTYNVHDDSMQALFYDGVTYSASPLSSASDGTVVVTRSDSRIEGTFNFTLVDAGETTSVKLSGTFGIDRGFSLQCP